MTSKDEEETPKVYYIRFIDGAELPVLADAVERPGRDGPYCYRWKIGETVVAEYTTKGVSGWRVAQRPPARHSIIG